MIDIQSLVHPPDKPEELEEHKSNDGMANGCRAYASVFLSTFMMVVDKSVAEQKVRKNEVHIVAPFLFLFLFFFSSKLAGEYSAKAYSKRDVPNQKDDSDTCLVRPNGTDIP